MARNVEVKARLSGLDAARGTAAALGARFAWIDEQVDRYYQVGEHGRVKLRTCGRAPAELIRYTRPETAGVRASEYEVLPVRDTAAQACLVPKTPPVVVVRKCRELWLLDNVRIHLDTVDGLGTFLELEAVVDATHDEVRCREQVGRMLPAFGVGDADCLRASYSDLLRA
jgi:predicted adenylyl cyclase CyaB